MLAKRADGESPGLIVSLGKEMVCEDTHQFLYSIARIAGVFSSNLALICICAFKPVLQCDTASKSTTGHSKHGSGKC